MEINEHDRHLLKYIVEYCEMVKSSLQRFGEEFDIFVQDQDYLNSVSMSIMQIGELSGRLSPEFVAQTKEEMD